MAIGKRSQLLVRLRGCPHDMASGSRANDPKESKTEATMAFVTRPQKSGSTVPTLCYWSHRLALFKVGGDYASA